MFAEVASSLTVSAEWLKVRALGCDKGQTRFSGVLLPSA